MQQSRVANPVDAAVACRWIARVGFCDQRARLVLQETVGSSSNDERPFCHVPGPLADIPQYVLFRRGC